jgi:hypothetical protein
MMSQYEMRFKCRNFICIHRLLGSRRCVRRLLSLFLASLRCLPLWSQSLGLGNDVAPPHEAVDFFLVLKPQSMAHDGLRRRTTQDQLD